MPRSGFVERNHLNNWMTALLTSDDGLVGVRPLLTYATSFLPTIGAHVFYRRLSDANVRLVYDVGTDDLRFQSLIAELERRQVRLGWDAVILIGEWDSFYGRTLPIEFRAAACTKVATFSEADLKTIQVPVDIKQWCQSVPQAIDLQIQRPADYEFLTLNVFRYSYLGGLDGEIPGDDAARAARAATCRQPAFR